MLMDILLSFLIFGLGYGLGSIPFGLVLCFMAGLGDIRKIGSGNIGATNVLRTGHKFLALLTLVLDSGKGAIAVLLSYYFLADSYSILPFLAGFAAILGHNFPVWLSFKGGKGVATTLGTLVAVSWPVGLLCCLSWLITAGFTRISSLSALSASFMAPIFMAFFAPVSFVILSYLIFLLVFIRHRHNIDRLWQGSEPRIGKK
jgi:acyl phosphate:glycerol-3-phosphate acyltransferase